MSIREAGTNANDQYFVIENGKIRDVLSERGLPSDFETPDHFIESVRMTVLFFLGLSKTVTAHLIGKAGNYGYNSLEKKSTPRAPFTGVAKLKVDLGSRV